MWAYPMCNNNIITYVTATCLKTRDHHLPIKVRRVGRALVPQHIRRCRCRRARLWIILLHRRRTDHNTKSLLYRTVNYLFPRGLRLWGTRQKKKAGGMLRMYNIFALFISPAYAWASRTWKNRKPPRKTAKNRKPFARCNTTRRLHR